MDHDGHGEVYAFTVIRHAVIPSVADALPLIAAVVELVDTDGCRLVGNVVDAAPGGRRDGRGRADRLVRRARGDHDPRLPPRLSALRAPRSPGRSPIAVP